MKRRQAREIILQMLFQYEYTGKRPDTREILSSLCETAPEDDITAFIKDIVNGTIAHREEIDALIQSVSKNWDFSRLASVDRSILRFATYELLYRNDIPNAVTINESVDIAKKFSTADSYAFINGVLDKIAHRAKPVQVTERKGT